jgi:hypothetical protein
MEALTRLIARDAHGYPSRAAEQARAKAPNGVLGTHRSSDACRGVRSQTAELDRGRWVSVLRIGFGDGGSSEFEVPRIQRDTAEQVVHALGGRVS